MGSYSAPTLAMHFDKFTVDLTSQTNEVIFGPQKVGFGKWAALADVGFDGQVELQVKDLSGNWGPWREIDNATLYDDWTFSANGFTGILGVMDYPQTIRVIVTTPPTLTTARIYITWFAAPANPLF